MPEELESTFVPLNDLKQMKRTTSMGAGSDIDLDTEGEEDTTAFRVQAAAGGKKISLWHDISLVHMDPATKKETPYMNYVNEIPKFTRYVSTTASNLGQ